VVKRGRRLRHPRLMLPQSAPSAGAAAPPLRARPRLAAC